MDTLVRCIILMGSGQMPARVFICGLLVSCLMGRIVGNVSPERFRSELSCFRSGVDIPAAAYFQELMQAYPNAKVFVCHCLT